MVASKKMNNLRKIDIYAFMNVKHEKFTVHFNCFEKHFVWLKIQQLFNVHTRMIYSTKVLVANLKPLIRALWPHSIIFTNLKDST